MALRAREDQSTRPEPDDAQLRARHEQREAELTRSRDYLLHREKALDRDLLPYGNPSCKDVLVFGSGVGNEVLWAARHNASSVVGIDLNRRNPEPVRRALQHEGISFSNFELRQQNVHDLAVSGETFDLIVSNGVFEHVMDLKGVLAAFREVLRPSGRVAVFADSLWYSSLGGHFGGEPWEHLWRTPSELHAKLSAEKWDVLCNQLNRMTVADFLQAVCSVGMIVLQLRLGPDPNLSQLRSYLPRIQARSTASPSDLSVVSIGCELYFEENLQGQSALERPRRFWRGRHR